MAEFHLSIAKSMNRSVQEKKRIMRKKVSFVGLLVAVIGFTSFGVDSSSAGEPWWTAPKLKYVEIMDDAAHGASPHYWTFGGPSMTDSTGDQTYLYTQDSGTNANFSQYVVAELRAAKNADEVTHRWAATHVGLPKGCSQFGDRVVIGNGSLQQSAQPFCAYPDDYTLGSRTEAFLTSDVAGDCDTMDFNHDGTLLFTNHYPTDTGTRDSLHCYKVTGSLDADGVSFTLNTAWKNSGTFHTAVGRLRNFTVRYINGKDLIYYGEGDTINFPASVYVFDPASGEETCLMTDAFALGEVADSDIVNVKVSGVANGEPYLHVMPTTGGLKIYKLSADGKKLENDGNPVATLLTADLDSLTNSTAFDAYCRAYEVTDDNEYAFFSAHNAANSIFVFYADPGTRVIDWSVQ
jgi:hypothetical protein